MKSLAVCIALSIAFVSACGSTRAETLQAGISEVNEAFMPGHVFQPPEQRIVNFYPIPSWFAGKYTRTSLSAKLPLFGSISRKSRHTVQHGQQTGSRGTIWHAQIEPYLHVVEDDKEITYYTVLKEDPLVINDQQVIIEYLTINSTVSKKTGRIVRTMQSDETHNFVPGPNGTINASISPSTIYNEHGRFVCHGLKVTYTDQPIEAYHDIDSDDNFDYRLAFRKFLRQRSGY